MQLLISRMVSFQIVNLNQSRTTSILEIVICPGYQVGFPGTGRTYDHNDLGLFRRLYRTARPSGSRNEAVDHGFDIAFFGRSVSAYAENVRKNFPFEAPADLKGVQFGPSVESPGAAYHKAGDFT